MRRLLPLLILLLPATLPAQSDETLCQHFASIPLPAESNVPTPKVFPACESWKSYFGVDRPVDYAAARACAWQERAAMKAELQQNPAAILAYGVGGPWILTNLYANGLGTPRNLPLAVRIACDDPLDMIPDGFGHLAKLVSESNPSPKPFDSCEWSATTVSMSFCSGVASEVAKSRQTNRYKATVSQWPQSHQAAFWAAKRAYDAYVHSVESKETYMGGTIRTMRANAAGESLQDAFASNFDTFNQGKLPSTSPALFAQNDADLNRIYRQAIAASTKATQVEKQAGDSEDEIRPAGIRDTERAWLAYRDAWADFATLHYPQTNREAWLDSLTQQRTHQLLLYVCSSENHDPLCTPAILKEVESTY